MTKGEGQKSQKIDDVFYERPLISSFHLLNMWCEISEKGYHLCFRIPLICRKYVHAKIIFKPNLRVMAHLISLFQNVLKSKYSGLAEAEIVYKNIA